MARPEVEPKTPLGRRLREVRKLWGNLDRADFASALGLKLSTIAGYERGETAPDAEALASYRQKTGININWLATGDGPVFDDPALMPVPTVPHGVDVVLFQRLGDTVQSVFIECKQKPPQRAVLAETANLYNELLSLVTDLSDERVVDALVPVLRSRFKERLARAEPGTGKRSAS